MKMERMEKTNESGVNYLSLVGEIIFGLFLVFGFYLISRYNYLFFHVLVELFSIVIAIGIFIIVWSMRKSQISDFFTFIAIAFFFVAGVDLIHLLVYKGMGVFNVVGANSATQLWLGARFLESASLLTAIFFLDKNKKLSENKAKIFFIFIIYSGLFALLMLAIFLWKIFPTAFIDGQGLTFFKKISEYVISLIIIVAFWVFYRKRKSLNRKIYVFLSFSIVATIFSELAFTLYTDPYGFLNVLGHLFKVLSFYLIYRAIVDVGLKEPMDLFFSEQKRKEKILSGALMGSQEVVRDFREKEQLYKDALIYTQSIIDTFVRPIIVLDNDLKIVSANQAFCDLFKTSLPNIKNEYIYEVYHGIFNITRLLDFFKRITLEGVSFRGFEVEFALPQIGRKVLRLSGDKIDQPGKRSSFVLFGLADITRHKLLEEKLRENKEYFEKLTIAQKANIEEMKKIDVAKTEFISMAAHQLRTPLATISLTSEMLLRGVAGNCEDPDSRKYLEDISQEIRNMSELIEIFLNISRIELGTFPVEPTLVSITAAVDAVLESVKPQIAEAELSLKKNYEEGLPMMNLDQKITRVVIENLFSNSIKYTPRGGAIDLEIKKTEDDILIKVSDTGRGIPADQLDKIFEKMYRAHNVRGDQTEGVGLGLYMVKSMLELAGGRIRVESKINRGTTFYITIPLSGMKKNGNNR